jgi:hypothetical protein
MDTEHNLGRQIARTSQNSSMKCVAVRSSDGAGAMIRAARYLQLPVQANRGEIMRATSLIWLSLFLAGSGCGSGQSVGSKSRPSNGPSHHAPRGPPANRADLALAEAKRALARGGSPAEVIEPTYGLTRMHVEARDGNVKLLRFLIDRGGDVNICAKFNPRFVALLLRLGADPSVKGNRGKLPIDYSKEHGLDEATRLLAERWQVKG